MDRVFDTLERIRTLWKQVEGLDPKTSEYEALVDQIRTLSDEYMALINAPKRARTSK
jgi:hypothetical protein